MIFRRLVCRLLGHPSIWHRAMRGAVIVWTCPRCGEQRPVGRPDPDYGTAPDIPRSA